MKIIFNEATPEQWAAIKEKIAAKGSPLSGKVVPQLKELAARTKDHPEGICIICKKDLPEGRRRFCPSCVEDGPVKTAQGGRAHGKQLSAAKWLKNPGGKTIALVLGLALASCAGDDAVERMNRKNALEQIQMDRRDAAAERMLYDAQAADPDTTRL